MGKTRTTKILFIDRDDASFQVRKCVAQVINELPPLELFQAKSTNECLSLIENLRPDVVVIDEDSPREWEVFLDQLSSEHPPIVITIDRQQQSIELPISNKEVSYIPKSESLDDLHKTLIYASKVATNSKTLA